MDLDPVAFSARFEASLDEAIAPFQAGILGLEAPAQIGEAIFGVVSAHVASGDLPLSGEAAVRLSQVVASAIAQQAPELAGLALPDELALRPLGGLGSDDVRVLRERFVGWLGKLADDEAIQLVVEGTMAGLLGGSASDDDASD
jgi:hypothetical protein